MAILLNFSVLAIENIQNHIIFSNFLNFNFANKKGWNHPTFGIQQVGVNKSIIIPVRIFPSGSLQCLSESFLFCRPEWTSESFLFCHP
jgi:hypothetical protein